MCCEFVHLCPQALFEKKWRYIPPSSLFTLHESTHNVRHRLLILAYIKLLSKRQSSSASTILCFLNWFLQFPLCFCFFPLTSNKQGKVKKSTFFSVVFNWLQPPPPLLIVNTGNDSSLFRFTKRERELRWQRGKGVSYCGCIGWSVARSCKHLRSPGIDSEESIPPAYVAWRAGLSYRPSRLGIDSWAP
jgi:hypothetical protein